MIIKLQKNISRTDRENLLHTLNLTGIECEDSEASLFIHLPEPESISLKDEIEKLPGVEAVIASDRSYYLVSREYQLENTLIRIDGVTIGGAEPIVIAGPCAVESQDQILRTAEMVKSAGIKIMRGGAFKPRTSPYSFTGLEEKGLQPDLVITDVVMPGMSGSMLVERLWKNRPDLKVLYMSGYADSTITHHGILDPSTPFIQKPFSIHDLAAKCQEILRGKPGQR
jgi:CheY-like chemotaxis protein